MPFAPLGVRPTVPSRTTSRCRLRRGSALVPAGHLLRGPHPGVLRRQQRRGRATSPGSSPSSTTSSGWGSTACGCCPFYPSPLRDGGYDISDYFSVHPESGHRGRPPRLLDEAHARGIRVIADLVINHTSDQHPWFIESRQSRDNPKADWYVWNDDDQRWPEARVVFVDVERSNWAYDPQRDQYYWHRFYSHQPDLNYDNPEVADAMLDVVRFWLDLGLDGFRLDAVPYLYQRDGTAGREPARDPRLHPPGPGRARRELPGPDPAGRGQRMAGRRGRLLRRRRRVPSVLQLPPHAPAVHGRPARAELPDHRDPGPDPRAPRAAPSGPSSCATTTS